MSKPGRRKLVPLVRSGKRPQSAACSVALRRQTYAGSGALGLVGFYTGSLSLAGNPAPFALTPFLGAAFTDRMGLLGRAANAAWHSAAQLLHAAMVHFFLQPVLRRHIVFRWTRSAESSGVSERELTRALQDLEEWVSGGAGGFVYVSMGSSVRASNMPAELRVLLADALGRLPFRVLWKWDGGAPAPAHLPPNVRTGHWFPQQDLLGHPRIRAFVTHGGLLSLHEAVHHAVPVVALPVFCDHDANAAKAAADGYALRLELRALSAQRLADAVQRAVRDPRYRNAARERSVLLRDQPETPLQRAIYWSEYVIRHRGAEHLLSPAREMSLVQYFLLDVIALYAAALVLLVVTAKRAVRLLLPSFVTAKKLKAQ
ncbi:UDP-glycosyltransferase UGT50A4 [Gryllus bimaculatus]|nr:UDP-glycosyltransferase UGT50A4 [Gryllus bimaculatus]